MKSLKSQLRVRELFGSRTFGRNFAQLEFVAFFGGADIQTKGGKLVKTCFILTGSCHPSLANHLKLERNYKNAK